MFAYALKDTKANSEKFGPCEICMKETGRTYLLTKYMRFFNKVTEREGLSHAGDVFGHKACLSVLTEASK